MFCFYFAFFGVVLLEFMHLFCVVLCTVLEFMHDVINSLHNNDDTKVHDFCANDEGT